MIWFLCLLFPQIISGLGIRIFESREKVGSNYNFPPPFGNSCVTLPPYWRNRARSIDSQGACVKVWKRAGCKGESTRVGPGTPDHHDLSGPSGSFEALSACTVEVYTDDNFGGSKTQLPIPTSGCLNLEDKFKNSVRSVDTQGNCVRLWYKKGCESQSHQLRSGQYSTLSREISSNIRWVSNFEAISDCNTHFFAQGSYHHAETGTDKCFWLPPNKKWTSINPQGRCVRIYSAERCNGLEFDSKDNPNILKDLTKWNKPVKSVYVYDC